MHEKCPECGLNLQPEAGYYLGSIYFNYGLTALLVLIGYGLLFFLTNLSETTRLIALATLSVLFPLWFFRYARAMWLALDRFFDRSKDERRR